ncbi:MAG: ATP synthase F0 subunit C [Bdellovibrionaceae bacterium]|nr:ATP synthase F0 subunit C [Pseudobdellovibrionaceae bacterium]
MKKVALRAMFSMATVFASSLAMAADGAEAATAAGMDKGLMAIAAAIAISIAALGGALAQGRTAATALDGIARNPAASGKILVPMILGLALIESLVIYALIIALRLA